MGPRLVSGLCQAGVFSGRPKRATARIAPNKTPPTITGAKQSRKGVFIWHAIFRPEPGHKAV